MVDIQSKEVIDKISDELKIQPSLQIPRALAKDIQLVYDVGETFKSFIPVSFSDIRITTGTSTLLTAHATRRTFLTGISLSTQADATANNTTIFINATLRGRALATILRLAKVTTTLYEGSLSITFPTPIEIEPSSTVTMTNTFTVGASSAAGSVHGFEVHEE